MRNFLGTIGVITAGVFIAAMPAAQAAGDRANGEKLSRIWCAACHVVADDQKSGLADVPTFHWLARDPLQTSEKLSQFLRDPHPLMPDMTLSRNEVADIVAYIQSLN